MKSLIFTNSAQINHLSRQSSVFRFALPRDDRLLLHISRRKWPRNTGARCAAEPASYGGWDDLRLVEGPVHSGESAQLRRFLVSAGLDDKRYVLVFVLGLVSALAITRVRVSSVVIFPASVLIFAVGFSFGLVRGGIAGEVNGSKKLPKEDAVRFSSEKLKFLVDFFDGLDARVDWIKNDVQKAIDCNRVSLGDLRNYLKEIELVSSSASKARGALSASVGSFVGVLTEDMKSSKKRRELGKVVFNFVGGLFGESPAGSNANKSNDNDKQENAEDIVKDHSRGNVPFPASEESNLDDGPTSNHDRGSERGFWTNLNHGKVGLDDREGFSHRDSRFQFVNNERVYMKASSNYETRTWRSQDNLLDFTDNVHMKNMETEASIVKGQWGKESSETYTSWNSRDRNYSKAHQSQLRGRNVNPKEDSIFVNDHSELEGDIRTSPSSRMSEDVVFDRYLTEANNLLKRARDLARTRSEEDHAQAILYKTAEILTRATAMKPMSLLAVGQLGNTCLLHGELKLRMSRDLRTILSSNEPLSFDRHGGSLSSFDYDATRKDKIASALIGVCEECEDLLMEAGRKYRLALSIDGDDVRALYNWGLALSFRAELIADIGPEAAYDADKVFLAAIDKFNAMMSKGNAHAPDALFRWGVVLQQRSRLRPRNSKEKVKLLEQAKRLYEDALHMESDNPRVREALSSCISELSYRNL
ncbi:uncharacterized protein LOC116205003 isoform X2 [Punica granatum]|uniref:Uncharacterized protein n=2 Tax=Punica granatum TaxID=22663 RepID=A0A218Y1R8_PUNGR|nr:uncharacterized protein LOC116205003 isoform X2 [Punica granatum]OWM91245.1 hypothetical protein CDL15_Pgr000189 [Punica granatum]PKI40105.1 hypothetical protein CRG98_039477 [Punica granatum]